MFSKSADLYDLIYQQFKDYADESRRVAELLERIHPEARTVLDVACGTGEHARILARDHGYRVDGLDLEPGFVRLAEQKHPEGRFVCGDMTDFDVGDRYDVVLCLFSSIGYVRTLENVERALRQFRKHLAVGGVVVVEPWIEPADWRGGRVFMHTAEFEDISVCRMSHSVRRGRMSELEFHYLVGRGEGIEHLTERHELGLFTRDELKRCFVAAGLGDLQYDPKGLVGRGLFTAQADGSADP
jgi:SAM-dependent methyltransferase